jgi:uncharacterized protein (DUF58 family)
MAPIWQRWLARRLPPSTEITLSHRSIFILPSGFGLIWLALVLLLYLFGTNYQNNLVIGLSILLLSLFNTCILYSYKNLAGLHLRAITPPEVYAGETITFPVLLSSNHMSHNVNLSYPQNLSFMIKQVGADEVQALVPFEHGKRGRLNPGRLKIESFYPLGLCRAWSHIDLDTQHLVYAAPIEAPLHLEATDDCLEEMPPKFAGKHLAGIDEFKGLKPYVLGESLKQVAWKQWAQGRGLLTKEFEQPQGDPVWLRLRPDPKRLESQLSQLSWQVNKLSQLEQYFGLLLHTLEGEDIILAPAIGNSHRVACQKALALYPQIDALFKPSGGTIHPIGKMFSKRRDIPTVEGVS